jgi:hypothetical protein
MNVTELIDQILSHTDNIGASDSENADRRIRILEYVVETFNEVWFRRDWPFTRKSGGGTVTVPALQGWGPVPADYSKLGDYGGLYHSLSNGGGKLEWRPEHEINIIRQRDAKQDLPWVFSIFGVDETGPTPTFRELVQIPISSRELIFTIQYHVLPPTLDEAANVENLRRIPERYHQTVLVPGVRYLARRSKGDNRAQEDEAKFEKGIDWMKAESRRFQGTMRQLPSFFGR